VLSLLVLLMAVSPAVAARHKSVGGTKAPGFAAELWRGVEKLVPFFTKSSGTMDPDGKPLPPSPRTTSDASGTMDPDGK
jgi:hypothetical protein